MEGGHFCYSLNKMGGNFMSIGRRLNTIFGIFLLLISTIIVSNFFSVKNIESNIDEALDSRVVQIRTIDNIRYALGMQEQ